jgi:hypothetical protein
MHLGRVSTQNIRLFGSQTRDKIIIYVSTRGHWDCTTLQYPCTTFSSGYTEVLQGGTNSMPTGIQKCLRGYNLNAHGYTEVPEGGTISMPTGLQKCLRVVQFQCPRVYRGAWGWYNLNLYTRGHWECTTLRHFCIPVGIEIVPPQALLYTCGHWDCTTLKHFCIAWGEGCTGVLKGGTISMPTSRHVDNDFIPGLRTKKSYILSGFSCSSCNVIVTFLYLWTKIP